MIPLVVMDKDAFVDAAMTSEEAVAHTSLACTQLVRAGYFPMLVRSGARVEVLGVTTVQGASTAPGRVGLLLVDADAGLSIEQAKAIEADLGLTVVWIKPGSRVDLL